MSYTSKGCLASDLLPSILLHMHMYIHKQKTKRTMLELQQQEYNQLLWRKIQALLL